MIPAEDSSANYCLLVLYECLLIKMFLKSIIKKKSEGKFETKKQAKKKERIFFSRCVSQARSERYAYIDFDNASHQYLEYGEIELFYFGKK